MSWLLRRFKMFQDILRDTEIYQYIMQEGVEKGREEGLAEGIQLQQERELQHQRLTVVRMVQTRFPRLASFAIEQTDSVRNPLVLQDLIVDI